MKLFLLCLFFALSSHAADLLFTWTPSPTATTDGLTSYVLQKEGPPNTWTNVATVAAAVTTCELKNVGAGTHTFRVIGVLLEGVTSPTNSVTYVSNGPTNLQFSIKVPSRKK